MKKQFRILLCLVLIVAMAAFTGCSGQDENPTTTTAISSEESTSAAVSEATTAPEGPELAEYEEILDDAPAIEGLEYTKSLKNKYAQTFHIDYYAGGYELIRMENSNDILLVPENADVPNVGEGIDVVQRPIKGLYVANTSSVSLIKAAGKLDAISFVGTDKDKWYVDEVKEAMESGQINFGGKYSEPDFETLMASETNVVIESKMINNKPEIKNKFAELGMYVVVDKSGEEPHPLGRIEWMKLYGTLVQADMNYVNQMFEAQVAIVEGLSQAESTGKTVAIFFISSKGQLYVRNTDDYVTEMTRLAGGKYIFDELENSGSNSTKMEMEAFYETAKDADYILYMYSIGGRPDTIDALVEKNALIADFKAVKEGNVWATKNNFFQVVDVLGNMVGDLNTMLTDDSVTELDFIFKIQN